MAVPSSLPVCPLCRPALPQRRVPHSIPLAAGSRQESRAVFPQFLDSFLLGLNKSPHCFPNEQLPEARYIILHHLSFWHWLAMSKKKLETPENQGDTTSHLKF